MLQIVFTFTKLATKFFQISLEALRKAVRIVLLDAEIYSHVHLPMGASPPYRGKSGLVHTRQHFYPTPVPIKARNDRYFVATPQPGADAVTPHASRVPAFGANSSANVQLRPCHALYVMPLVTPSCARQHM